MDGYDNQPEGVLLQEDADMLFNLAKNTKIDGVIVNLGAFCGKSSIALALGSHENDRAEVFSVDMNEKAEFFDNIKKFGVKDLITPLRGLTDVVGAKWNRPIKVLFVDADHSYTSVRTDIEIWAKHVVKGGMVAFHDTEPDDFPPGLSSPTYEGPTKAVREFIMDSKDYGVVKKVGTLSYAKKLV